MKRTIKDTWSKLETLRRPQMHRWERYAQLTLPYLLTPEGHEPDRDGVSQDWQSVGALVVNNLVTRLILTLFAPSRPFVRLDPSFEVQQMAREQGWQLEDLAAVLAEAERRAVKVLDQYSLRPKLFEAIKHLIVLGNVLEVLDDERETIRVISAKNYVVKRNIHGELHTVIIREHVPFGELADEVREIPALAAKYRGKDDDNVDFFISIKRTGKDEYTVEQAVDEITLGPDFTTKYSEETLPYRVLTWSLADEANYGTGMVEACSGDLEALSTLSKSMIEAAVLASEYRWLVNPGGLTKPEDFENSKNGQAIPGAEGDVTLVQAAREVAGALQITQSIATEYINRIGRTFLLTSSVIRDAERVTTEEIRLLAGELETGLGGAYSRLAVDLQKPLARFLLRRVKITFREKDIVPTVVTGLDALSRNGDLANLQSFLNDLASLATIPEWLARRLNVDNMVLDLGTPRGVDARRYIKSQKQIDAEQEAQLGREAAQETAIAAGTAAAQGARPQ